MLKSLLSTVTGSQEHVFGSFAQKCKGCPEWDPLNTVNPEELQHASLVLLRRRSRPELRLTPSLRRVAAAVDDVGGAFEHWVKKRQELARHMGDLRKTVDFCTGDKTGVDTSKKAAELAKQKARANALAEEADAEDQEAQDLDAQAKDAAEEKMRLKKDKMLEGLERDESAQRAQNSRDWVQVPDPSAKKYWWNKKTNETTEFGEPKPSGGGEGDWVQVPDPSAKKYWWNRKTNKTTDIGAPKPPPDAEGDWVQVSDPSGSGKKYWWNKKTNETTDFGEPKPQTPSAFILGGNSGGSGGGGDWVQVPDPNGSGKKYWWNKKTNETTEFGEPKPSGGGEGDWVQVSDPSGSGKKYWWNRKTNETTEFGEPKPSGCGEGDWVQVSDPNGSGKKYWWNKKTNETTEFGEPKPPGGGEGDWVEVPDPSAKKYWWNRKTNETTEFGKPEPPGGDWVQVPDPAAKKYWWNKKTNETTEFGEPKPSGCGEGDDDEEVAEEQHQAEDASAQEAELSPEQRLESCGQFRVPSTVLATRRAASEAYWAFDKALTLAEKETDAAISTAALEGA